MFTEEELIHSNDANSAEYRELVQKARNLLNRLQEGVIEIKEIVQRIRDLEED